MRDDDHDREKREPGLTLLPIRGEKIRWLPRHGEPVCIVEWISQSLIKALAWAPVYTAVVVTLILLMVWFGPPFGRIGP